jgi:hypothetical protein
MAGLENKNNQGQTYRQSFQMDRNQGGAIKKPKSRRPKIETHSIDTARLNA